MNRILSHCPVCTGDLYVSELSCDDCATRIGGKFEVSPLTRLSTDHAEFVELFLRSRGNLSSVADTLEVSFPTASRRLDAALIALGYMESAREGPAPQPIPVQPSPHLNRERELILEMLDRGEITAEEATRRLKDM